MAIQKTVAAATLCKFLGLKQRRVYQLVDEGILFKEEGHGGKFPLIENVNRYITHLSDRNFTSSDDYDLDLNEIYKKEKVRLTKAQADNEEIKAQLASERVIEVERMRSVLGQVFTLMRERMLNVPDRSEGTLVGELDKDIFRRTLLAEIKDSMHSIDGGIDELFDAIIKGDSDDK